MGGGILFRPLPRTVQSGGHLTAAELQLFAGTTLFAALAGYFIFLHLAALITEPWYFLPLLALGASCFDLAVPVAALPRLFRVVVWGISIATVGVAVPFAARDLNCRFTNVDLVAKRLMKEVSPQDYVVVTPWYLGITFAHYYQGAAGWDTLPPVADHSMHRFDLLPTAAEDSRASQPVLDRIANTLQAGHQVWIVGSMSVPVPGRRANTRTGQFIVEHSQSFDPVDLKIKGQTSDYEEAALLQASGWKTSRP